MQEASRLRRDIWNYLSTGNDYESAKSELNRARTKSWYNEVKNQDDRLFEPLPSPAEISRPDYRYTRWFKQEMNYNPVPALVALHVPALFLFGDEDRLVNVNETVVVLRRVLTKRGHRDFTIQVFHHVGHDMHVTTGEKAGVVVPSSERATGKTGVKDPLEVGLVTVPLFTNRPPAFIVGVRPQCAVA